MRSTKSAKPPGRTTARKATATKPSAAKAAPALPRSPGRPSTAANVDQRALLLDAAIALFSERGIAATSLRAIAQAAGVTPALLHYYFTSKDSLVETMIVERIAPFFATSTVPLDAPLASPRATLRKFIETHMRNIASNPWMPRLMVREVLSDGGALRARMQTQFAATIAPKTVALIAAAQQRGEIRSDLNPLLIGISLIGIAVFPFAAAPVWREVIKSSALDHSEYAAGAVNLQGIAGKPAAWEASAAELLIAHTLALFDSALEPLDAKPKR